MWRGSSEIGGNLLNRIYVAQECDARKDDSSKVVGSIKEKSNYMQLSKNNIAQIAKRNGLDIPDKKVFELPE